MHRDTCALEPIWIRHTWELDPRHARMVLHLKVLHPKHPGCPLVVTSRVLGVEDPDDSALGKSGHHKWVCEPVDVDAEENSWPCGKG
jgi:hypothetical protein